MSNKIQNIGAAILSGAFIWMFIKRQSVRVGVRSVSLSGMITQNIIPLRVALYLINDTIGSILIRSISCQLVSNGLVVADISQNINKRIAAKSMVDQDIYIDIHNQAVLSSLFTDLQGGDITNTSFTLVGDIVVGERYPFTIKINKLFTWEDIRRLL